MNISKQDTKALSKELGSQDSGFGELIIFPIFDEQGGTALIAARWGILHIFSGFDLAPLFMYRKTFAIKTTTEIVR